MEKYREKNSKSWLRLCYLIMLCFCFYHLVEAGYYIIVYPDHGRATGVFSYPLSLSWLGLVFSFWFFFAIGCLLSIYFKKAGWILTNASLIFSLGFVVIDMFTQGVAIFYLTLSFVLLFLLIFLGQKGIHRLIFTEGKMYTGYVGAIGIAVAWVILFLLVDKH